MTYKSYIYQNRHKTYYFRIVIPKDLRDQFRNKREIRRSLRTDSRSAAIFQARFLWVEFQKVFSKMSKEKTDQRLSLELITHIDAFGDKNTYDLGCPEKEAELIRELDDKKTKLLLKHPELRQSASNAKIDAMHEEISRIGELIGKPYTNERDISLLPLSDLIEAFIKDQGPAWTPETAKDYQNALDVFKEIIGDIPISSLNKVVAREFKETLQKYPLSRTKGTHSKKTLEEIIKEGNYKAISATTVNKNFTRASTFMNWCDRHGYCDSNPLKKMTPRVPKTKKRRSFTDKELSTIFSQELFTNKRYKEAWQYWLPILAYATGARIEELCQLNKTDIKAFNNMHYFDIVEQEGTRLKNKASNRRIPIHSMVVKLGFLDFVDALGTKRLFALDHYKSKKLSHQPSKWFGRFKTNLEFSKEVTFHSFRHTMRDMLSDADVPGEKIKAILGHEQGDETFGTYGSNFKPEHLNASIQKLELPELEKLHMSYP